MIEALVMLLFLLITFLLTAGGNGLRRLVGLHANRQLSRRLPTTFRVYQAAFGDKAAQGAVMTAVFGVNCSRFITTVAGLFFLLRLDGWPIHGTTIAAMAGELLVLLALLLWIDLGARAWSHASPEKAMAVAAPILSLCLLLLFPLTYPILKGSRLLRSSRSPLQLREELAGWLDELETTQAIDRASKQLLEAAADFHQRLVREVMVPRAHIFALPANLSLREATQELVREEYSRVPIFDGSLDTITGILMAKDVLRRLTELGDTAQNEPVGLLAKRPLFVPETQAMGELLNDLRRKRTHMAIVVDEYGSTAGIVTIEDLLEELVGEIADEYDVEEQQLIQPSPQGGWLVNARISIADLEDRLSIQIPQNEDHAGAYDTLGGYIVHRVGSIPPQGLHIQHERFDLEILRSTERSVELVRIIPRHHEG